MENLLLGIDIGTSGCKLTVFDREGLVRADCTESYPTYYENLDWAEQDASDWWQAVTRGVRRLMTDGGVKPEHIAAIGVAGQSWSCLPLDQDGHPLRKAIIWLDRRANGQAGWMRKEFGAEYLLQLNGNPVNPGYIVPKILWLQEHEPMLHRATASYLQSNSYIVYRLTGKYSQDLSQGNGLHFFDITKGRYNEDILSRLSLRPEQFAPVYQCHQIVGMVTSEAAVATGLVPGIPVVAGGLDAACATLGAGVLNPGETQEQGGQAGGMSIVTTQPKIHPRLILGFHVIPEHWLLQGGTVGGGGVLNWFNRCLGAAEQQLGVAQGRSPFAIMDDEAGTITPGANGLIFLPYMAGERSPLWDPAAQGVFFGLSYDKTRAHLIRAMMEGVGFSLFHNLLTAAEAGVTAKTLNSVGGAANSAVWCQIKADITGKLLRVPCSDQATTLGAALLAGVGVGLYPDFQKAVELTVTFQRNYQPQPGNFRIYQQYYQLYLELYQQLKDCCSKLQQLVTINNTFKE